MTASKGLTRGSRAQIWSMPVVLTVTSAGALVVGLVADGAADIVAFVGLSVPIFVTAWHALRAATQRHHD